MSHARAFPFPPATFGRPVSAKLYRRNLSPRQQEILECLADGLSVKEIATKLGLKINTVDAHKATLFDVLGATNSAGAVGIGYEQGYLKIREP